MQKLRPDIRLVLLALLGMSLGWIVGKPSLGSENRSNELSTYSEKPRSIRPAISHEPQTNSHSFRRLAQRMELNEGLPKELMNWISRSHTDQLYRELLLSDASFQVSASKYLLRRAIAREIYRRDGVKCLDLVEVDQSQRAIGFLLGAIASNEPELAKSELKARGLSMELNLVWQMTIDALRSSAVRGASELLKSENFWGEGGGTGYTEFAEDFNFREYLSQTSSSAGKVEAFKYLAAKDPDEAAACLQEGYKWEIAGSMLDGRSVVAGRQEAIQWIANEIGRVPDRYRRTEINGLARHCDASDSEMMMNQLSARQDRLDFAVSSISQFRDDKIEYFATLPEEFRIRVMSQWLEGIRLTNWGKDPEMALKMMNQMKIPAVQHEALLKVQSGVAN